MIATSPFGVVDIGSNSVRLFQVHSVEAGLPEGPRQTHVVGLKKNASADGTLAPEALERLARRLNSIAEEASGAKLEMLYAVGTSAVRDAPNHEAVERLVMDTLGTELTILTGHHEAELSYRGARLAHREGAVAVLDVGGASTEIAVGRGATPEASLSVDIGGVRCNVGPIAEDPPAAGALKAMHRRVHDAMATRCAALPDYDTLVGVAGTLTSLAAIDVGRYDPEIVHGHVMTRDRLADIMHRLGGMRLADRRTVPGLHPNRAPVIVVGAAIALGATDALGATSFTVSERDLLDGVASAVLKDGFRIQSGIS